MNIIFLLKLSDIKVIQTTQGLCIINHSTLLFSKVSSDLNTRFIKFVFWSIQCGTLNPLILINIHKNQRLRLQQPIIRVHSYISTKHNTTKPITLHIAFPITKSKINFTSLKTPKLYLYNLRVHCSLALKFHREGMFAVKVT